ncbi:uncharacterized protein AUP68_17653 [Ilyonectria robusta]
MKLQHTGRIAFRRAYADEAPKSKPKPKAGKLRSTLRWTWRFTYLSLLATVGYTCYQIWDDRHPEEQFQSDPSKKTLVVLGKLAQILAVPSPLLAASFFFLPTCRELSH